MARANFGRHSALRAGIMNPLLPRRFGILFAAPFARPLSDTLTPAKMDVPSGSLAD